jgi:ferredoxin
MSDYPIGYIYCADKYCPSCIVEVANLYASVGGLDPADTETRLDFCASQLGLDRSGPFDSGDFPAPFVGTPHDGCSLANGYEPGQCGDQCATCHIHLGHPCPNAWP